MNKAPEMPTTKDSCVQPEMTPSKKKEEKQLPNSPFPLVAPYYKLEEKQAKNGAPSIIEGTTHQQKKINRTR